MLAGKSGSAEGEDDMFHKALVERSGTSQIFNTGSIMLICVHRGGVWAEPSVLEDGV